MYVGAQEALINLLLQSIVLRYNRKKSNFIKTFHIYEHYQHIKRIYPINALLCVFLYFVHFLAFDANESTYFK